MKNDDIVKLLRRLRVGKPGVDQPRNLRGKLMGFEKQELVTYKDDGWYLTAKGEALVKG